MELARMDDIAGCRIIFNSIENLTNFRNELHEAKFNHKKRNESDKYNYIKSPKSTGYRGIHDVYEYDVKSIEGAKSKGLFVEIQYRTAIQHAWATAVEVIGHVTESQPKFQQGDKKFETAMAYASEILARAHEKMKSCYPELENKELVEKFLKIDKEVSLIKLLKSLNSSNDSISRGKNAILIMDSDGRLEIRDFKDATDAIRALFELEKSNPGKDIVLVRADTGEQMRNAFRNYFADAREFVTLIEEGCAQLSGSRKSISTRIKLKQPPK